MICFYASKGHKIIGYQEIVFLNQRIKMAKLTYL